MRRCALGDWNRWSGHNCCDESVAKSYHDERVLVIEGPRSERMMGVVIVDLSVKVRENLAPRRW